MDEQLWIQWLDIRDKITCTGNNVFDRFSMNNIQLAIQLLKDCQHEEAQWLWKTIGHCQDLAEIQVALSESDDPRAQLYAYHFDGRHWEEWKDQVIEMANSGYSFAQLSAARASNDIVTKMHYLRQAVAQRERKAYDLLRNILWDAVDSKAFPLIRRGAELGDYPCMQSCYRMRYVDDITRYKYFCALYKCGKINYPEFTHELTFIHDAFTNGIDNQNVMIVIADSLKGFDCSKLRNVMDVINAVHKWRQNARDAIDAWTICAKRMGLYRDVHKMISLMIWSDLHSFSRMK